MEGEKNVLCAKSMLLTMYNININFSNTVVESTVFCTIFCTVLNEMFLQKPCFAFPICKMNTLDIGFENLDTSEYIIILLRT